jgi:hypothetical protein
MCNISLCQFSLLVVALFFSVDWMRPHVSYKKVPGRETDLVHNGEVWNHPHLSLQRQLGDKKLNNSSRKTAGMH